MPLALVMAEMGEWEGLLAGVVRLLGALERGPPADDALGGEGERDGLGDGLGEEDRKGKAGRKVAFEPAVDAENEGLKRCQRDWTSAPLLTLLHLHANTGLPPLASVLHASIEAISTIWLSSLTSFLIFGRPGKEPLVVLAVPSPSSSDSSPPPLPTTTQNYTFPSSSLPYVPTLSNPSTRAGVLASLSNISLALSVLHSLPHSNSSSLQGEPQPRLTELSRALRRRLESEMQGCTGPGEEAFSRRIARVESQSFSLLSPPSLPPSAP